MDFGDDELQLVRRLQPCFGDDILVVIHRKDELRRTTSRTLPQGIKILWIDDGTLGDLGLAAPEDWGWRCGDYVQIYAASRWSYDFYWMIEPDVCFNFEDLNAFFRPLQSVDADFLAPDLSRRTEEWAHHRPVSAYYADVWGCLYPLTRISRRAVAVVHAARRNYGRTWSARLPLERRNFCNDESFVCSCLTASGLTLLSLNDTSARFLPRHANSFTYHRLIVRDKVNEEASRILHPVVSKEDFFRKLRGRINRDSACLVNYYRRILEEIGSPDDNAWFSRRSGEISSRIHCSRQEPQRR